MIAPALVLALSAMMANGPDTVVVCPPIFVDALRPWIAHRAAQGHRFAFVPNALTAEQIRADIREQAKTGDLKYVVLVGDAEPAGLWDSAVRARSVPAFLATARVNVRWKSTPEIATDNWYADLDDDGVPDIAIGRLPADSPQDLAVMVAKIVAYETVQVAGPWNQRISFVAGVGGLGPLIDPIVEMAAKKFLTDGIPPAYATSMTYASWRSPFCPNPPHFHAAALNRFNEGCLFWVYIGHGYPYQLDRVRVPGASHHILSTADMVRLDNQNGMPIAIFLACYTGAYDQQYDCLAEQMVRAPGGPVAAFAGSRVTMPYAMSVLGNGLMDGYFRGRYTTLGDVILYAKRQMIDDNPQGADRKLLDLLAKAMSPDPQLLQTERQEHLLLFNLFGDPLLKLQYPQTVQVEVPAKATAGTRLEVKGYTPVAGLCRVLLVCRRDRMREEPPARQRYDRSPAAQMAFNSTYAKANDRCWSQREIAVERGPFLTSLKIPPEARGACHVCVFLENGQGREFALGSADLYISTPKLASLPAQASLSDDQR
ncbi:MAG: C25 family cysteine peptidase [Pirellulaceae bacterium]